MAKKAPIRVYSLTRIGAYAIETFYPYPHKKYGMPLWSEKQLEDFRSHASMMLAEEYTDYEVERT